jgi:shikimate kinase
MRNIILCGFMGCGKTTVGKNLAALTGRTFIDMDTYIEERAGMSVPDIFRTEGEPAFRRREATSCMELSKQQGLIIAAGGGALTFPANVQVLAESGVIIWLKVSPETVLCRLAGNQSRPLLAGDDKESAVRELYAFRQPLYEKAASVQIDGEQAPSMVAQDILLALSDD